MSDGFAYLSQEEFDFIFGKITEISLTQGGELAPPYKDELRGTEKLFSLSESLKSENYPTLLDKAVFFFLSVAKNHFFSNGNKRLSVFCLIYFLWKNGCDFKTKDFSQLVRTIQKFSIQKVEGKKIHGKFKREENHVYIEKLAKFMVENPEKLNFDQQKEKAKEALSCLV